MRMATAIAMTAVGSVLTVGSCVAYVVVAGWPLVSLPLSTPYTATGTTVGASMAAGGVWLLTRTVRRGRRVSDLAAAPAHGGAGAAATQVIPKVLGGVEDTAVRFVAGRVPFPPEPGRPALSVHGLRGGRGRQAVAAAA